MASKVLSASVRTRIRRKQDIVVQRAENRGLSDSHRIECLGLLVGELRFWIYPEREAEIDALIVEG